MSRSYWLAPSHSRTGPPGETNKIYGTFLLFARLMLSRLPNRNRNFFRFTRRIFFSECCEIYFPPSGGWSLSWRCDDVTLCSCNFKKSLRQREFYDLWEMSLPLCWDTRNQLIFMDLCYDGFQPDEQRKRFFFLSLCRRRQRNLAHLPRYENLKCFSSNPHPTISRIINSENFLHKHFAFCNKMKNLEKGKKVSELWN